MTNRFLVAAVLATMALPAVGAHAAPDPRDQDTRLLEDWNDDCGGDGGAAGGSCKGSIDVIALDLRERHDPVLGDVVGFLFILDKGQPGMHTIRLTLDAAGNKTFSLQTSDDQAFTGVGFAHVSEAASLHDGTRFMVEATVKRSELGAVGASIARFKVESMVGPEVGDFMPGGCHNTVGDCVDTGQSSTTYIKPSYTLRGPTYYGTLARDGGYGPVAAQPEAIVALQVRNSLRGTPQAFTLTASSTAGQAMFIDAAGREKASVTLDLEGGATGAATLVLRANASGATRTGTATVEAMTDLGGRLHLEIPFAATPSPPATSKAPTQPAKDSPAPVALALLALAAAATRRR